MSSSSASGATLKPSSTQRLETTNKYMKRYFLALSITALVGTAILLGVDLGGKFSFLDHKTFAISTVATGIGLYALPASVWGILTLYFSRKEKDKPVDAPKPPPATPTKPKATRPDSRAAQSPGAWEPSGADLTFNHGGEGATEHDPESMGTALDDGLKAVGNWLKSKLSGRKQ